MLLTAFLGNGDQGTGIRRGLADYEKQYEIQSERGAQ